MKYGYQGQNSETKDHHLFDGMRCDKLFTAIATVRAHQDKYEKDFDTEQTS